MITFTVVREANGWTGRMGEQMTAPFWSRRRAVREAHCMADAIRRHGQGVSVLIDDDEAQSASTSALPAPRPAPPQWTRI
jgi:hypothetical protein